MRTKSAILRSTLATLVLALVSFSIAWASDSELKLAGLADVPPTGPGGALTLPLASGSPPVTLLVSLGEPAILVAVQITPSTAIEAESFLPVTLVDGDRVKIEGLLTGGVLQATKLEIEDFPELQLPGTAQGLPASGVALPLPSGASVVFTLSLGSSGSVPVRVTSSTRIDEGPGVLMNGASMQVEGILRDSVVEATELDLGDDS